MDDDNDTSWRFVRRGDKVWQEQNDGGTPGGGFCLGDAETVMQEMCRLLEAENFGEG